MRHTHAHFFSSFELLFEQSRLFTYMTLLSNANTEEEEKKSYLGFASHTHIERRRQIDWRSLINEYFRPKLTLDYFSSLISCDFVYV